MDKGLVTGVMGDVAADVADDLHKAAPASQGLRGIQQMGQSLWLDQISRNLLRSGTLQRYIDAFSITGLTSNPSIYARAIDGGDYDDSIRSMAAAGLAEEPLFFELAIDDLGQAADLLKPAFEASGGTDGWVSLEVSPLLADNTAHTIQAASHLFDRADRANLFIKIPGTPEGLRAVEEVVFDGVPVNVTLLFSPQQHRAAAEAYLRAIERRLQAGLSPQVASVASVFVSRWDVAVQAEVAPSFQNRLGIAMAMQIYRSHLALLHSERWQRLAAAGARPQRLLWASTGSKDPAASDVLYVQALVASGTINTMPEKTLLAYADNGHLGTPLPADGGYADAVLEEFRREGVDDGALALRLQREGVEAFANDWHAMMTRIREKSAPHGPG